MFGSHFSIDIPRIFRKKVKRPTPGSPPGTLMVSGELPPPTIQRMIYDEGHCDVSQVAPQELEQAAKPHAGKVIWIDIQGLGDAAAIRNIEQTLGLHPLTAEDIVHLSQRPKLEEFDDYLFVVLRALRLIDLGAVDSEQISLILKPGLVVTFQERPGDGFEPVRRRLMGGKGKIRRAGVDYLLYTLIDAVIDNYFPVLEVYGDVMDRLDAYLRQNPTSEASKAIHTLRRELRLFRRMVWPLRDLTATISRAEVRLISAPTRAAFRDCYDHVIQVSEFLESSRERSAELADLYLIMMSEKTNQVMKVLTIIATIFIPLTFICGVYGMNFNSEISPFNMPELNWRYGYPGFWIICVIVTLSMLWFFKRKGWYGGNDQEDQD